MELSKSTKEKPTVKPNRSFDKHLAGRLIAALDRTREADRGEVRAARLFQSLVDSPQRVTESLATKKQVT